MMVEVYLADGRTIFRALSRSNVVRLFTKNMDKLDDERPEVLWAHYGDEPHPQTDPRAWRVVKLLSLRKHSVSYIRQMEPEERDPFLRARVVEAGDSLPPVWRERLGLGESLVTETRAGGVGSSVT